MIKYEHLMGREFKHGEVDCYTLVRDFYRDNYGLELTDYARPDAWWYNGLDLYMDNFRNEGFESLDIHPRQMQEGDGILMAIYLDSGQGMSRLDNHNRVANHMGIYIGGGEFIHHCYGRFSKKELFKGLWFNTTVAIIRHPQVKKVEEQQIVDVREFLAPRVRAKIEETLEKMHTGE